MYSENIEFMHFITLFAYCVSYFPGLCFEIFRTRCRIYDVRYAFNIVCAHCVPKVHRLKTSSLGTREICVDTTSNFVSNQKISLFCMSQKFYITVKWHIHLFSQIIMKALICFDLQGLKCSSLRLGETPQFHINSSSAERYRQLVWKAH